MKPTKLEIVALAIGASLLACAFLIGVPLMHIEIKIRELFARRRPFEK